MHRKIIQSIMLEKFAKAKELVFKSLYAKSALSLDEARRGVASFVFNTLEEEEEEEETEVQESNMKEIDTDRLLKKWRKDHVSNFHLRKAKEKASRSPEQVKKDADADAYSAAHVKKTGKRLGRID